MLKFSIVILLQLSPTFMSVNVCLIYLSGPMLGAHIFTIVISSRLIP